MARRDIRAMLLVGAMAATTTAGFTTAIASGQTTSAQHTVVIEAMQFDPQELTVQVGDRITWVNHDPFPHTVSAIGKQFECSWSVRQ